MSQSCQIILALDTRIGPRAHCARGSRIKAKMTWLRGLATQSRQPTGWSWYAFKVGDAADDSTSFTGATESLGRQGKFLPKFVR